MWSVSYCVSHLTENGLYQGIVRTSDLYLGTNSFYQIIHALHIEKPAEIEENEIHVKLYQKQLTRCKNKVDTALLEIINNTWNTTLTFYKSYNNQCSLLYS